MSLASAVANESTFSTKLYSRRGGIHLETADRVMVRPRLVVIVSALLSIPCTPVWGSAQLSVQINPLVGTISGRLATVSPALRLITLVPEGETKVVELVVAAEAPILLQRSELTLEDLVVE